MNQSIFITMITVALFSTNVFAGDETAMPGGVVQLAQAPAPAQGQPAAAPTPQQRVAMLKQWLQASQAQLRSYEWVETTVIAKDGKEKSRHEAQCYYGVDGKLQRVPVGGDDEKKSSGPRLVPPPVRLIEKAAEHEAKETQEYTQKAIDLVHQYIPPDQNRIQQAVDAGKMGVNMLEPGRRTQLTFKDYLKAGDQLSVDIEVPTNRLLGLGVASYIDKPEDAVQLAVTMGVLPDGTIYTEKTALDAKAKGVTVTVENTGYRKTAR